MKLSRSHVWLGLGVVTPTLVMSSVAVAQQPTTVRVWMRAFIPNNHPSLPNYIKQTSNGLTVIEAPDPIIAGVRLGPLAGTCFATDNRGFSNDLSASARVTVDLNIIIQERREIKVESVSGSGFVKVGETHNVDCKSGRELQPARKEDLDSVEVGTVRKNGFLRVFNVKASSGNPFYKVFNIGVAPKIDYEVVFTYDAVRTTLSLKGVIGNFPSFEAYGSINGQQTFNIVQVNPAKEATAMSLFDGIINASLGINTRNFSHDIDLKSYIVK